MRRVKPLHASIAAGCTVLIAVTLTSRSSNSDLAPAIASLPQASPPRAQALKWEDEGGGYSPGFGRVGSRRSYSSYAPPVAQPTLVASNKSAIHAPAQAPDPLHGWRMAGKFEMNGRRGATLENSVTHESTTVWEGDEWRGMKIAGIGEDGIRFDDSGTVRQLTQNGSIPPSTEVAQSFATGNDQGIEVLTGDLSGSLGTQVINLNTADGEMSFTLANDLKGVKLDSGAVFTLKVKMDTTAHDNAVFEGKQPPVEQAAEVFLLDTGKRSRLINTL